MLQSQINYWNLQEQKRHNLLTEQAANEQAAASMISASASRTQAEIAKELVPFEKMKAQASKSQADASLLQADAALQNAETNRGNLVVNQRNAATNERNAETNRYNADINAYNAAINQQNANTNAFNAETNRIMTESNIVRNQYENIGTIIGAGLDAQRKETEEQKTAQEKIHTKYTEASDVVGLLDTGSHTVQNVTGSISNVVNMFRKPKQTSQSQNNNHTTGTFSIVGSQLDALKKAWPVISTFVK